jgi:hypothetical protein
VQYTPDPGFAGTDTFTYAVRDSASQFPRSPATATVTIRVGEGPAPSVQISGAPATMLAGTSVQLQATVTGEAPKVTWSVDGKPGGSAAAGTITPGGLYSAPAQPPSGGSALVTARTASGASDERRIAITTPPPPQAAPLAVPPAPAAPAVPGSGVAGAQAGGGKPAVGARLSALRAHRIGRWLVLTVTPRRAGLVRLRAFAGGRLLGSCSTRTPAGRSFACRLRYPGGLRTSARIAAVASLRVNGKVVAVKRRAAARVPNAHAH